jgi:hypothetical protein
MTRRIARTAQVGALVLALIVVPAALAAKGGAGSTSGGGGKATSATGSFSLKMVTDQNGDGLPNWNDQITFNVSSTAAYPMVNLSCYQGTTQVHNQNVGFYSGWPWSQVYTLSHWYYWPTDSPADCTATLYYQGTRGNVTVSTMSFHVGA